MKDGRFNEREKKALYRACDLLEAWIIEHEGLDTEGVSDAADDALYILRQFLRCVED